MSKQLLRSKRKKFQQHNIKNFIIRIVEIHLQCDQVFQSNTVQLATYFFESAEGDFERVEGQCEISYDVDGWIEHEDGMRSNNLASFSKSSDFELPKWCITQCKKKKKTMW